MTKAFRIKGLGCAACAAKMEKKIASLPGVVGARVNFLTQKLTLETEEAQLTELSQAADRIIRTIEPGASLVIGSAL